MANVKLEFNFQFQYLVLPTCACSHTELDSHVTGQVIVFSPCFVQRAAVWGQRGRAPTHRTASCLQRLTSPPFSMMHSDTPAVIRVECGSGLHSPSCCTPIMRPSLLQLIPLSRLGSGIMCSSSYRAEVLEESGVRMLNVEQSTSWRQNNPTTVLLLLLLF